MTEKKTSGVSKKQSSGELSAKATLSAMKRELKKETALRKAAEKALLRNKERATQRAEKVRILQLQSLSRRVLLIQEEERKRISRELHDVIAQTLAGINIQLAALKIETAVGNKDLRRKICITQKLVEKSVGIVHRFAYKLRPPVLDDLGLIPALHALMKKFSNENGVRVNFTAFAGVEKLGGAKRIVLYRIVQEALNNVFRHAQASQVEVLIEKLPKGVHLQIQDDGKSFDAKAVLSAAKSKRLGLIGMRERVEMIGGKFKIDSAPGQGTTINVHVPSRNQTRGKAGR